MSQVSALSIPLATAPIRIAGLVQGDVIAEDALVWIEAGARVEGEVRAASLFLAGELAGSCRAQSVWLQASASMTGLLECLWLAMDEGARFVGQTIMPSSPPEGLSPVWPVMEPVTAPLAPGAVSLSSPAFDWSGPRRQGAIGLGVICAMMAGLSLLRHGVIPASHSNVTASAPGVTAAITHPVPSASAIASRPASAPDIAKVGDQPAQPSLQARLRAADKLPVKVPVPAAPAVEQKVKTLPHTPVGAMAEPSKALVTAQEVSPPPVKVPVVPARNVSSAPKVATPLVPAKPLPDVAQPPKVGSASPGNAGEGELLQQLAALQASMLNALVLESTGVKGDGRLPVVARIRSVTATLQLTRSLMRKYAHGGRSAYRGLLGSQGGQWEQYRHQLTSLISAVDPATLHADSRQLMASLAHLPA